MIVVATDNDRLTAGNPGVFHGTEAATAINAGLVIPQFPGDLGTDFNDLKHISGIQAVRAMLENITQPAPTTVEDAVKTYELRPYQSKLIDDVRRNIIDGIKSQLISSPTGSGKTVMFVEIIKRCRRKGTSVLFMVHRQEILYQVAEYLDAAGIEYGVIKGGEKHEDHHIIQLAMFQTIARRLKSPYIRQADIIIIDEAHLVIVLYRSARVFLLQKAPPNPHRLKRLIPSFALPAY